MHEVKTKLVNAKEFDKRFAKIIRIQQKSNHALVDYSTYPKIFRDLYWYTQYFTSRQEEAMSVTVNV